MMQTNTKLKRQLESLVFDLQKNGLQLIFVHAEEPSRIVFETTQVNEIKRSKSGLTSRSDENQYRLGG